MDNNLFLEYGFSLSENQLAKLDLYSDLLIQYNEKFNLTAITNKEDIYVKNFLDCLYLCKYLDSTKSLLDIGSGAGFPGVIIKIFYPEMNITLLEPNNKKVMFLNAIKKQLDLSKLEIINQRSEDYVKDNPIMPFCHQSCFVRTKLMQSYLFDTSYRIVADHDLFFRLHSFFLLVLLLCTHNR